jgi:hypothetical protein
MLTQPRVGVGASRLARSRTSSLADLAAVSFRLFRPTAQA